MVSIKGKSLQDSGERNQDNEGRWAKQALKCHFGVLHGGELSLKGFGRQIVCKTQALLLETTWMTVMYRRRRWAFVKLISNLNRNTTEVSNSTSIHYFWVQLYTRLLMCKIKMYVNVHISNFHIPIYNNVGNSELNCFPFSQYFILYLYLI